MLNKGHEEVQTINLMELVTPETDNAGLMKLVDKFLTPDDRKVLGEKGASEKVANSIAYLAAFPPAPSSFDKPAFSAAIVADLPVPEQDMLWILLRKFGILKNELPSPLDGSERVSISPQFVETAKNQFFTE